MSYYEENQMQKVQLAGAMDVRTREVIPYLKAQRQELASRIQKIDTLLMLLENNPEFVKMLDLTRELI